jgi:hypothetical protein
MSELAALLDVPESRALVALKRCDNDLERATDYILTHQDETESFWEDNDD